MKNDETLFADIRNVLPNLAQLLDEMKVEREQGSGLNWSPYCQEQREALTALMHRIDARGERP